MYNDIFVKLDKKNPSAAGDNTGSFNFNLSSEETNSGQTWIDGKTIYRKLFSLNSIDPDSDVVLAHEIESIDTVIKISGFLRAGWDYQYNLNDVNATNGTFRIDGSYIKGHMLNYLGNLYEGAPIFEAYLILEYTIN